MPRSPATRSDPSARRRLALALFWIAPAASGSNYLIARAAAPYVTPHLLAFGRWGIVFLLLLATQWRSLRARPERIRMEWRRCLVLGALGMGICGAWVYLGGRSTSAINIGLIYAAAPLGIALGSRRMLGEPMSAGQGAAMLLALAGVVLVLCRGDPAVLLAVRFNVGDLWIVGATLSWIAYSLLLQFWPSRFDAAQRLCCISAGGLIVLAPFVAAELLAGPPALGARGALMIVLAALLPGLVAYLAYSVLQEELGARRAGMTMYVAPVYAGLLSWWLLGEAPRWFHLAGALMILPGIHFASRQARVALAAAPPAQDPREP